MISLYDYVRRDLGLALYNKGVCGISDGWLTQYPPTPTPNVSPQHSWRDVKSMGEGCSWLSGYTRVVPLLILNPFK